MKSLIRLAVSFLMLSQAACTYDPYFAGKSAADIPSNIKTIRFDAEIVSGLRLKKNEEPAAELDPSNNDQEVLQLAKTVAITELNNFGYKVLDTSAPSAEISTDLYIVYVPERWPLVGRICNATFRVADPSGGILDEYAVRTNSFGLVGALAGPSRDEMVTAAVQEVVVKAVNEMKKGTAPPVPEAAVATSPSFSPTPAAPITEPSTPPPEIPFESQPPEERGPQAPPIPEPMREPQQRPGF